jgi:hypothetical protein
MLMLVLISMMSLMLRVRLMRAGTLRRRSVICVWIHGSRIIVAMRTTATEVVVMCLGRRLAWWLRSWSSHMVLLEEVRKVLLAVGWYVVGVVRLSTCHAWWHTKSRRKSWRITMRHLRRLDQNTRIVVLLLRRIVIHDHVPQLILELLRSITIALVHLRQA